MSNGWSEVFEPGLRFWHEEQQRRDDDRHEVVAAAPPGDKYLKDGVMVLDPVRDGIAKKPPSDQSVQPDDTPPPEVG